MAAAHRYRGLLAMNTTLGTGDAPLSPGFIAWRDMCAKNPEFDVARLFARGNPQMSAGRMRGLQRAVSGPRPPGCAARLSARWCRTIPTPMARPFPGRRVSSGRPDGAAAA